MMPYKSLLILIGYIGILNGKSCRAADLRLLYDVACLARSAPQQCDDFCRFLGRSTCEEYILRTNDLMMRCNQSQKAQWNKMIETAYSACEEAVSDRLAMKQEQDVACKEQSTGE